MFAFGPIFSEKMAWADHSSWNIGPLDQFFRQTKISVTGPSLLSRVQLRHHLDICYDTRLLHTYRRLLLSAEQHSSTYISAFSIVSKWRGDSEKRVRVLFELARFHAPSTIFVDELESIMSQRGNMGSG